jgi:hypothetical protein
MNRLRSCSVFFITQDAVSCPPPRLVVEIDLRTAPGEEKEIALGIAALAVVLAMGHRFPIDALVSAIGALAVFDVVSHLELICLVCALCLN